MRVWLLLVIALLGAVRSASADPADDAYAEGRKHYDLQEWDLAIAKFKDAYAARPEPRSLFNIAQSYRLKGDCVEAVRSYKTYERNYPSAANIALVQKFIASLEECAKKGEAQPQPEPNKPEPAKPEPEPSKPEPSKLEPVKPEPVAASPEPADHTVVVHHHRTWTWVAGGAAVVSLGVATYYGAKASSDFDDYKTTRDPAHYAALKTDIPHEDNLATTAFVFAGLAAGAAGVLFFTEKHGDERVSVAVDPRTGSVFAWGRF